ncbi:MAG: hypothetical protein PHO37_08870 [Kiritimatiellae bacterium]|nr:hypothetical protein [Kiritimatiellia bacterium]
MKRRVETIMSEIRTAATTLAVGLLLLMATGAQAVVWINNGFEYPTNTAGFIGSDANTEGRWGVFKSTGNYQWTISDAHSHSGNTALRIYRETYDASEALFVGRTAIEPMPGANAGKAKQFEVSFWIYRDGKSSVAFNWRDSSTGSSHGTGGLFATIDGPIYISCTNPAIWQTTGKSLATDEWTKVRLVYDLNSKSYGTMTLLVNDELINVYELSDAFCGSSSGFNVNPQPPNKTATYIDDFYMAEVTNSSVYLRTGFEYTPGSSTYGDAHTGEGEWGPFGASAYFVNTLVAAPVHDGNGSWSATRVGFESDISKYAGGRTALFPRPGTHSLGKKQFELAFWAYHSNQDFRLRWYQKKVENLVGSIRLSPAHAIEVQPGVSASVLTAFPGATMPQNEWAYLRFFYDLEQGTHGEVTLKMNRTTYGPVALTSDFGIAPDSIRAYLSPNGTTTYIDNMYLGDIVIPPLGTLIMVH